MFDLNLVLLILIFSIPILVVVFSLVSKTEQYEHSFIAGLVLVIAGLILLAFRGETEIVPGWRFMGQPVTFTISLTAIWLYLAVLLALGGLIWRERQVLDRVMSPYQWVMLNLSLSAGFVAFFSGQFMIRYIALDIVGLLAALTALSSFDATSGLRHFISIFQILRLGDLSLLVSILLLNQLTGTLDIADMIAGVANLPANLRMWIFSGFLLALVIKLAIWPFGIWLEKARQSAPKISFWISGLLVPGLGTYLLYRILPILQSGMIFQNLVLSIAVVLGLLIILLTAIQVIRSDRFTLVTGVMGCFLLAAGAFGGGQILAYYLVGLVGHRLLLLWAEEKEHAYLNAATIFFPLFINGLYIIFNLRTFPLVFVIGWVAGTLLLLIWDMAMQRVPGLPSPITAQASEDSLLNDEPYGRVVVTAAGWLNRKLELGIFTHGIARMSRFFHQIADWMYHNIEMGMEDVWIWLGRKLVQISAGTLRKFEVDAATSSGHLMNEALNSLERYEEKLKRKALRWDLAWIPFLLVFILILLFVI